MERNFNSIAASVKESARTAAEGLAASVKINRNLIAAALIIACGTDEGERCAPPSGIILLEWPYNSAETGSSADTGTVSSETNETAETELHSGTTLNSHSATPHSSHSSTENHSGTPFIDSDGDKFSDAYEQSRGTNPNSALSKPAIEIQVMGFNSLVGYEDRVQPWTTAAPLPTPYTSEQALIVHPNTSAFIEVESYGSESVVGIRINTDDYNYSPQDPSWLTDCGSQVTPWDPTSQLCGPTANVTRVQDPTTLGQWSVLDVPYDRDSFTQWYRVLDPSGTPQEYPAMELRLP